MSSNLLKDIGISSIQDNLDALHHQALVSSQLDTVHNPQSITQIGGKELCRTLRKKVVKEMSHKIVEQHGGKMVKKITVCGRKFRCTATKVGKTCKYQIQYNK